MVHVPGRLASAVRRLSPKARLALSLGALAAVLVAVSAWLSLPPATLTIVCRHEFRKADITVSIDDAVVHSATMTGAVSRKWLGVVEKTWGTYTRSLPVSSGRHAVEVRLQAPGYDRTRRIEGDFRRGEESVLGVDSGRELALAWRGTAPPSAAQPAPASTGWARYAGSILLTIFGSIVSASIGVFVQDFIRARKARIAAANEARREGPRIAS